MSGASININSPMGAVQRAADSPLLLPYTYTSATASLAVQLVNPTDIFTLENPAGSGQVIRITAASCSGTVGTAITVNIALVKRSTLNTGGTSTTPASVAHDSNNPAAVGICRAYTANPTLGTSVGTARAVSLPIAVSGTVGSASTYLLFDAEGKSIQGYTLRPGQLLAISVVGGVTLASTNFCCFMEWTESVV